MSETLTTPKRELAPDWRESPELEYWREMVAKRAAARLAENPNAKQALELRNPKLAAEALYMLACTELSKHKISAELSIDRRELWRLERHHGTLEMRRENLAKQMAGLSKGIARLMEQKIDQLEDNPEALAETSLKDLMLSAGIAIDKAAMLSGMATSRVEHVVGVTLDDAMSAIAEAKKKAAEKIAGQAIEAEIIA